MKPQVVTRYVSGSVAVARTSDLTGVYWTCDGCGWRLKLAPDATPPSEHSEEIVLGFWPDPPEKVPRREVVPNCPNPAWRKVL